MYAIHYTVDMYNIFITFYNMLLTHNNRFRFLPFYTCKSYFCKSWTTESYVTIINFKNRLRTQACVFVQTL